MSGTPESTLADPDQVIADLQPSLPNVRPRLISGPPNTMHSGGNLLDLESSRPRGPRGSRGIRYIADFAAFYHPNGRACIRSRRHTPSSSRQ